ncbi:MAG: hypothetical protein F6K55_28980 [Moorea sp. SIO4A3]|nr:hypothetical protein [Moorena sp. SIO4A3]
MANLIRLRKTHHYGLGGSHGAYKVRTQVPHTAPPHERLHQEQYQKTTLALWSIPDPG